MQFAQVIKIRTSRFDEVEAAHEQWLRATAGTRTATRELVCENRDVPGEYWVIVEFPSWDDALRNNDLPATAEISQAIGALAEGPVEFVNLDVRRVD